jgi:hypothetical protein
MGGLTRSAEDSLAVGILIGLIIGLFGGIPIGWMIAQAVKPKEDSVVMLGRDAEGRIIDIVEKSLG